MELRISTIQLVDAVDREESSQIHHNSSTNITNQVLSQNKVEFLNSFILIFFIRFKKILMSLDVFCWCFFLFQEFQSFGCFKSSCVLFSHILQFFGNLNDNLVYVIVSFCSTRDLPSSMCFNFLNEETCGELGLNLPDIDY